jgi:exosortase/archaeosortase
MKGGKWLKAKIDIRQNCFKTMHSSYMCSHFTVLVAIIVSVTMLGILFMTTGRIWSVSAPLPRTLKKIWISMIKLKKLKEREFYEMYQKNEA